MSTFKQYIAESVKTYEFKVKIAGELPEGLDSNMKSALMKYDCASVSKGKRTPIQESPLEFPELKNTHVTIYDISCRYPVTAQVLREYLASTLKIQECCIRVRNPKEEEHIEENMEALGRVGKSTESILNKPYENEDHQGTVGEKSKLSFLKELEKTSHKGEQYKGVNDQLLAKSSPEESKAPVDSNIGTTSPVGSHSIKFVDPFKGR